MSDVAECSSGSVAIYLTVQFLLVRGTRSSYFKLVRRTQLVLVFENFSAAEGLFSNPYCALVARNLGIPSRNLLATVPS